MKQSRKENQRRTSVFIDSPLGALRSWQPAASIDGGVTCEGLLIGYANK
jgi:hypothetical protein